MPPQGVRGQFKDCVQFDDTLTIHFNDQGYFAPSVHGLFYPDLPDDPTKLYAAGDEIGPCKPVPKTTTEMVLGFFDEDDNTLYLDTLTITKKCK